MDKRILKSFFSKEKKCIVLSYSGYAGKICRMLYRDGVIKNLYHVPQCVDIIRRKFFTRIIEYIFEKKLAKYSSFYLACGVAEMNTLNNVYNIDRDKILFNPNSIPLKPLNEDEKRKYKYIFVGRIVKDKGIFNILEVFELLGFSDQLIVIGDGSELKRLKFKYPKVNFLGSIQNEKVFDYLKSSQFIISDSIIEGLPFSIIEAMSCGVVPILSNVEGHADLILNNYSGFLFKGKKQLINIIFQTQVISEDKIKDMSSNAVETIKNIRKIKNKLMKNYFNKYE